MASDAVGSERISRVVGYKLTTGDFRTVSPNLPQRIAILAEANFANQGTLDVNAREVKNLKEVGELYGYGSPIYQIMRILRPVTSDGVGGIPTVIYPQAQAVGATSKIVRIIAAGVADGNAVHTIKIAGRDGVDGVFYEINVEEGDTTADISAKINDAVNAVIGSPVSATNYSYESRLETKWKGLTANELVVTVDTGDDDLGLTYTLTTMQAGSGTPSVQAALDQFLTNWNTIVVNGYGLVSSVMNTLENFNGKPSPLNPTGRYTGTMMKPFIAISGSVSEDPSALTDSRKEELTIAVAPAPLSSGFSFEAAANMALLFARVEQDTPHLDVAGKSYADMPTPTDIGDMSDYNSRDVIVKKGCSTVDRVAERYVVQDFVTTYHPDGEVPPQFRYCRNIMLDMNVRFRYYVKEQESVVDKAIAPDDAVINVSGVIKPKQWKGILDQLAEDMERQSLIVDKKFMQDSISVQISSSNPDRLETTFRYKRSGIARISSTTATAGFNFGTV
jgi:phage tail sheath gpL-like